MYEYKVETYKIKGAEAAMNKLASKGWRVIAVSPIMGMGYGIVVTYERKMANANQNRKEIKNGFKNDHVS